MRVRRPIKIDPGLATIIGGGLAFAGAIIAAIIGVSCISNNLESVTTSSHSSESDSINFTDNSDSGSNSDGSDSSSSDSGSNSDGSDSSSTDSNSSSDASDSNSSDSDSNSDDSSSSSISSSSESDSNSDSSSLNSSSQTETSTFTSEINLTVDHLMTKMELYSSCSGVAYIYKDFLDANYIGKTIDELQITGWTISLHATGQTFSFNIFPKQAQNEFYYDIEFQSSKTFYDQNKIKNLISAELTENGDLKIMFNFKNIPVDLSSTYEILPGTYLGLLDENNIN